MFRGTDSSAKTKAATPPFPLYLLPSLKVPFRRRRQSSTTTTPSSPPAAHNPPSLSSSPSSSIDDHSPPPSPTSAESYSFDAPSPPTPVSKTHREHDPNRLHLTRTAPDILRCNTCATDIAFSAQIVSKGFTGRHGRAYLVSAPTAHATPSCPPSPISPSPGINANSHASVAQEGNLINIRVGRPENRQLVTGAHVVADINCVVCGVKLGWKYVDAREQAQKYKVGKFILETARVVAFQSWEDVLGGSPPAARHFYSAPAVAAAAKAPAVRGHGFEVPYLKDGGDEHAESSGSNSSSSESEVSFDSDDEDECEDIFAGTWDAEAVAKRRGRRARANRNLKMS